MIRRLGSLTIMFKKFDYRGGDGLNLICILDVFVNRKLLKPLLTPIKLYQLCLNSCATISKHLPKFIVSTL